MLDPLIKKHHYLIFFLIGYHLQQYNISKINSKPLYLKAIDILLLPIKTIITNKIILQHISVILSFELFKY